MKRTLVPLLVLASVTLAGCQTIRSHNPFRNKEPAYHSAQQEQPLEVPPGMDQPPTTEALVIPDTGAGNASATAATVPAMSVQAAAPPAAAATADSFSLSDTPDSAYRRVGLALQRSDVGKVTARDDATHSYQVAVDTVVTQKPEGGFLRRVLRRSHNEMVKGAVTVSVTPQGSGSVVTASGDHDAAARVLAVLKQRLQ